jgi:hypothetical protein
MVKPKVLLYFISSLNSPIKPFVENFSCYQQIKSLVVVSKPPRNQNTDEHLNIENPCRWQSKNELPIVQTITGER